MSAADIGPFDAETFLKNLSRKPGVYRMLDVEGNALYVDKARNLKNRVTSYFRASGLASKTMALVGKIADIQITVTNSETEALLLEQSLIKQERPPYNVVFRDDKSYPYIYLTEHKDFPRLAFHRGTKRKTGRYFGPFPSAHAVRESINILQKLFQIRQCDDTFFKNRSRPCLQYQIQRCSGPCVDLIDADTYHQDVELAVMFLEGRSSRVLEIFKDNMQLASTNLDFERAAKYRDQIAQLRRVQEQQYVHAAEGDVDVFALVEEGSVACVQALFIRAGRMLGQRTWFPRNELGLTEGELLSAFLSQYYFAGTEREVPKSVIISTAMDDEGLLAAALAERAGRKVAVASAVRGQRARWQQLAADNAAYSLTAYLADKRNVYARFVGLQEALGLEDVPDRLECFDISHTMGEATVASCVVFDINGPLKSDYRRFNIENITPGDDYGAMEQALRRRYTRLKQGEGPLPSLLIIDGGVGQLGKAKSVLAELQVEDVPILGIAKGPGRKPGLERFFLETTEINITPQTDAFHLLQHIRDEAHRFAITGHRQRRQKQRRRSELDDVPGVGPKRRRELLTHFGGMPALKGASVEEIAKVPGISRKLAAEVFGVLHAE
ncbi:MAG: excinuclease ABC subunit UvrC [Gammaproteobacteria bacterium]|nr:excinuclease ABC subunit UvrC [Gammaproteobacteria bacterium]